MVGMRMIKAEQLGAAFRRTALRGAVVVRADSETPAGTLVGDVRQRKRAVNDAVAADQRAAAFVGVGFAAMIPDRRRHARFEMQCHRRRSSSVDSSQKRSDRYFSPPSQKTTTMTACGVPRATVSAPARFAPLELATNRQQVASWRVRTDGSRV